MPDTPTFTSVFTDIADAIREKTGSAEPISPLNFATEISSIESGGAPVLKTAWSELIERSDSPAAPTFLRLFKTEIDKENHIVKLLNYYDGDGSSFFNFPQSTDFYIDIPRYVTIGGQRYEVMFSSWSLGLEGGNHFLPECGAIHIEYLQFYDPNNTSLVICSSDRAKPLSLYIDDCVDGTLLSFDTRYQYSIYPVKLNTLSVPTHIKFAWVHADGSNATVSVKYLLFHSTRVYKPKFDWQTDILLPRSPSGDELDHFAVSHLDIDHVSGDLPVFSNYESSYVYSLLTCSYDMQNYSFTMSLPGSSQVVYVHYFGQAFHLTQSYDYGLVEAVTRYAQAFCEYLNPEAGGSVVMVDVVQPMSDNIFRAYGQYMVPGSGSGSGSGSGE